MFCTSCGNQISEGQRFCASCGSKCPSITGTVVPFVETGKKEVPTFSEFLKKRNSDFDSLSQVKAAERKDRFVPKRKKKPGADLVKINVGIAHNVNGELKSKKSTLMPVTVPKTSSSVVVRRAALDKHRAHNSKLPDSLDWKLLYPDFQEVNNVPGSNHFFTVQKYKESLGKSYQRINLYLCRVEDLEDDHDDDAGNRDDLNEPLSGTLDFNFKPRSKENMAFTERKVADLEHYVNPVFTEDRFTPFAEGGLNETLDSSGEITFNFKARSNESTATTQSKEVGFDDSLKQVLPLDTPSFTSTHVQMTDGNTVEKEASETDDPYDLYCRVLDEAENDLPDEILLDDALLCDEMVANLGDQDPNIGLVSLESVLRPFYEKMERAGENQMQVVRVRRRHIWSDALRTFAKQNFRAGVLLSVHFIGEEAADMGGPRREFLRLLMKSLVTESGVLTGSDKRKVLSSSPLLVSQRTYFHAGKMVATSVLQGGPGLKCLSPAVYAYLSANVDKCRHLITVDDIPDVEFREKVKKIQSLSEDDFQDGVQEVTDFLLDLGITKVNWNVQEKAVLVRVLCEHLVINRNKASLDQFVDGFASVDMEFFQRVKADNFLFEKVFCFAEDELTPTDFRRLFNICFSLVGANDREGEELTSLWWEELIDRGAIPMSKILEFCTGADMPPPLGFDKKIDIMFFTQKSGLRRFPHSSTCALEMSLPRAVESYEEFEELMTQAIFDTCGFGKI